MTILRVLLLISLLLSSCNFFNEEKIEKKASATTAPINLSNVPMRWNLNQLPLNVQVADAFSDQEHSFVDSMGAEWEAAAGNNWNLYSIITTPIANIDTGNLSSYRDSTLGIYKSTTWFSDVSPFALAITQFFGFRRNVGTAQEYIELSHADIIVNYRYFKIEIDADDTSYDYPSIILHEMGHMIGLDHNNNLGSSVMAPSLPRGIIQRTPMSYDQNTLTSLYTPPSSGSSQLVIGAMAMSANEGPHEDEGQEIKGIIELRSDGTCVHRINGKDYSHHLK